VSQFSPGEHIVNCMCFRQVISFRQVSVCTIAGVLGRAESRGWTGAIKTPADAAVSQHGRDKSTSAAWNEDRS